MQKWTQSRNIAKRQTSRVQHMEQTRKWHTCKVAAMKFADISSNNHVCSSINGSCERIRAITNASLL